MASTLQLEMASTRRFFPYQLQPVQHWDIQREVLALLKVFPGIFSLQPTLTVDNRRLYRGFLQATQKVNNRTFDLCRKSDSYCLGNLCRVEVCINQLAIDVGGKGFFPLLSWHISYC